MWQFLQSKWQSLVFRLLFYFLISIVVIALVLAFSFAKRLKPHVQNEILPNVERYIDYLIDDIGNPPDLTVARQLAAELPFELRIEGNGVNWSSSPRLKPIAGYEFEPAPHPYSNVYIGHHRRDEYLLILKQGYQYLFAVDNNFRQGSERRHWLLFIVLGSILLMLYIAIRRLFRPIGAISRQVETVGAGDLTQSIETRGRGELALLAAGVNRMTEQIRIMLENKSGLLLAISHELRSPLTRMRVNLELLDESETRQQLIDDVREMEALVAAILESEKLNGSHAALNMERCEMLNIIQQVVQGHPCQSRIRTRMSPIEFVGDQLRLKLLVKNLLDNACHYSSDEQTLVDVILHRSHESVVMEILDQGIGIASEDIPRLTEAFYRPDYARQRNTGGYGLGLYLCKLIVDAHNGQITIESTPGKGTRVIVKLPLDNS